MRAAGVVALVLLAAAAQAQVIPFCESSITRPKIVGCTECLSTSKSCFYCSHKKSPIWTGSPAKLTECRDMSADAACRGATAVTVGGKPGGTLTSLFGAFCALCERADDAIPAAKRFPAAKCVRCQPNYGFDATGKCTVWIKDQVAGAGLQACKRTSMNTNCAECNPDGTCKFCAAGKGLLLPVAAIWLDAGYPESQCMGVATVQASANQMIGNPGSVSVAGCAEASLDFGCVACVKGYSPRTDAAKKIVQCVPNAANNIGAATGSGCNMALPYMQYCRKCVTGNPAQCLADGCLGGRSRDGFNLCSLDCKGLYGIACASCNANACLSLDAAFKSGR